MHESLALTVYSTGGSGVAVGSRVGVRVRVGVTVIVTVTVGLGVGVGSTTRPVPLKMPKTAPAPMASRRMTRPMAIGSEMVTAGMRAPCTVAGLSAVLGLKLRPHTRQRVAFSASRVPQVGQV